MKTDRREQSRSPSAAKFWSPDGWVFVSGLVLISGLTLLAYSNVHAFQFVNWDDNVYITGRPEIQDGLTRSGVFWAFTTFQNSNWHPLTWLSYMAEIEFFGLDSGVMHLTNLALHCLNTVLVGYVVRGLTRNAWLAMGVALFFGVHPQHVEAVAWVSERKELLGVFFGLQAMLLWQQFIASGKRRFWFFAHLLFILSLLAKQMLITLPFLLVVLAVSPLRPDENQIRWRQIPQAARSLWGFFVLSLFFTTCVFLAQDSGESIVSREVMPVWMRVSNAIQSVVFYIAQTFVPVRLNPFYRHPSFEISSWLTVFCAACLMGALWFVWTNRSQPGIVAGSLWFLGTLVPVVGLVQLGSAARADRYMYFPHIGLFLLIGSLPLFHRTRYLKVTMCVVILVAVTFSWMTFQQVQIWRDGVSLWSACVRVDPDSYRGHDSLALALLVDEQIPEALRESQIAIKYPENRVEGMTYTTLGCALLFSGDTAGAIENLREAIRLTPEDYRALTNLGYALHDSDLPEAKRLFSKALKLDPGSVEAMANLANCEAEQGHFSQAIELLERAIRISPNDERLEENLKRFREAQRQQQEGREPPN